MTKTANTPAQNEKTETTTNTKMRNVKFIDEALYNTVKAGKAVKWNGRVYLNRDAEKLVMRELRKKAETSDDNSMLLEALANWHKNSMQLTNAFLRRYTNPADAINNAEKMILKNLRSHSEKSNIQNRKTAVAIAAPAPEDTTDTEFAKIEKRYWPEIVSGEEKISNWPTPIVEMRKRFNEIYAPK